MSKPIYWAIGIVVALAVVWMVMNGKETLPEPASVVSAAPPPMAPASPRTEVVATQPESTPAPAQLVNAATAKPPPLAAKDEMPIDVSPGFELLNTKASSLKDTDPRKPLLHRHEELQAQPRDPNWSDQMEATIRQAIQDSLTEQGVDTHRVELPVVECRTTGCEIQAIGFREDNRKGVNVQLIVAKLLMGHLGSELDNPHGTVSSLPDGRLSYIVFLGRRGR